MFGRCLDESQHDQNQRKHSAAYKMHRSRQSHGKGSTGIPQDHIVTRRDPVPGH